MLDNQIFVRTMQHNKFLSNQKVFIKYNFIEFASSFCNIIISLVKLFKRFKQLFKNIFYADRRFFNKKFVWKYLEPLSPNGTDRAVKKGWQLIHEDHCWTIVMVCIQLSVVNTNKIFSFKNIGHALCYYETCFSRFVCTSATASC